MNIRRFYLSIILVLGAVLASHAQTAAITEDTRTEAQLHTSDSIIEVTLAGGAEYVNSTPNRDIDTMGFTLMDAPPGVYITKVTTTSTTAANVTLRKTLDFDVDSSNAYIIVRDSVVTTSGDLQTNNFLEFVALVESVAITNSSNLDEQNLDNGMIELTLTNDSTSILGGAIDSIHFRWDNFPDGTSIGSIVSDADGKVITINLDYTPGDFDVNITNAKIAVRPTILTFNKDDSLSTNDISITASSESVSVSSSSNLDEQNLDDGIIVLTLVNDETNITGTITEDQFIFDNLPAGTTIENISADGTGKLITINLAYTPGDFDANITNAEITVKTSILTYSKIDPLITSIPTITATSESVSVNSSSNLDEQNLDDGTIVLELTNDETIIKNGVIPASNFTFSNLPTGTTIQGISSDLTGKLITINLNYTPGDFDTDIDNAQITVKSDILTYNKNDDLSTATFSITATTESVAVTRTKDLNENKLDRGEIELTLTNDKTNIIGPITDSTHFKWDNFPEGTTIENITSDGTGKKITIKLNYTPGDFDVNINAKIAVRPSILTFNKDDSLSTNDITITADVESVVISDSSNLDEHNLNNGMIELTLGKDSTIITGDLDSTYFQWDNFPVGTTIESISSDLITGKVITINLDFTPGDFETDIDNVQISVLTDILAKSKKHPLTTELFSITAKDESVDTISTLNLDEWHLGDGQIILGLTNEETTLKDQLLDPSHFRFDNFPVGTAIESIRSDITGTEITIKLDFDLQLYDFDTDISDARIAVRPSILTWNLNDSLSTVDFSIKAYDENPSSVITPKTPLNEYGMDNKVITLVMYDDWIFDTSNFVKSYIKLIDAPAGIYIDNIEILDTNKITIALNDTIVDFDANSLLRISIDSSKLVHSFFEGASLVSDAIPVIHYLEEPKAFMTPSSWLREFFLDTLSIDIIFEEEAFKKYITIDPADFGIDNGPPGLSVNGLTNLADSSVTLQLGFDGTDFDDSLTNVMIAINHEVLVQQETDSLRTDPFTIKANIEPVISDVTITDDTAMIDDVIMATIVLSEYTEDSIYLLVPGAKIGGYPIDSMKWVSHNLYNAWFTLAEGGADYFAPDDIPVSGFQLDDFPVEGIPYNSLIDQDFDHLDANKPVVKSLTAIGQAIKQIGDDVILLISAFEEGLVSEDTTEINMLKIAEPNVVLEEIAGGTYTLTYTIQPDDQNVDTGKLVSSVYLRDFAGNINDTSPKIRPNSLTIDASAPSIISMTNTTGASSAIIGDTVELTIVSDGTDYHLTEDSKVNGIKPEHGLILDRSGTTYYVRYKVKEGDDPVETPGLLKARITLEDPSGNTSPTDTIIANNDILVYPEKPTATLTGNDEICYNDTATLFVNLTGTGPWDITYSDADNSYMVTGIPSSLHTIRVRPLVNKNYMMDSVTDGTRNYNDGAGTSTVIVNPLPIPVISNLKNNYAVSDAASHELIGDPAGGVFSGPGVSLLPSKYVFNPSVSGLTEGNPHTIKYEYVDNEGCYEDTTQKVNIIKADVTYTFQKTDKWACYLDDSFTISAQNTSLNNGWFTVLGGNDNTPAFVDSLFYEESWDSVNSIDILTIHPSIFNWGEGLYQESHDYKIKYNYVNNDGVPVEALDDEFVGIEYFVTATITSDVGTTDNEFCSAEPAKLIRGNFGVNAIFEDRPGIKDLGGGSYQFVPEQADTGVNKVYYKYTASHGCVQKDSAFLTVFKTPAPRLARIDSCLATEGSVIRYINVTDTSGLGPVRWTWNFGDLASGPDNRLELFTMDTVSHKYDLGKYSVTLSVEVIATGCTEDPNSTDNYETFTFGNTPSPTISWTTECDKGIAIPISVEKHTVDTISNYHWIIKDQSGNTVINTEGSELNTLNFTYAERDKYNIEVTLETTTGCIQGVSDIIHLRPYFRDIATNGPIVEDFESTAEGWSSQGQMLEDETIHNSWKWEQSLAGQWPHSSANPSKAMYTELAPKIEEQSWVISPCYDFSGVRRPLVRLYYRSISDRNFDGAVLQYRIDDTLAWTNVGEIDDGSINWYNSFRIQDGPGGQGEGWTGPIEFVENSEWKKGLHELDPLIGRSTVQFRIAYSNKGESEVSSNGFAFDNFWIGERTRIVLIEHFTNSGISGIEEKDNQINSLVGSNYTDAIDLHYHTHVDGATDQMNTDNPAPASARSLFYGIRTAPYTFMDGGVNGTMIYDYKEELLDTLDLYTRALIDPLFEINLPDSIVDWTDIKVDIKALENLAEGEYILYAVIAEEDVNGYQNVVRDMLPSTAGISMLQSWTAGDTKSFDLSYNVGDFVLDPENLFVVAFIQDANTKLVYQAASTNTDLNMAIKPVSSRPVQDYLASKDLEMLVYPNPATNQAYLVFAEALSNEVEIHLFSHTGSLVRNALLPAGTQTQILDVSGLDQGVYLIRAIQKGRIIGTQRLMIMN